MNSNRKSNIRKLEDFLIQQKPSNSSQSEEAIEFKKMKQASEPQKNKDNLKVEINLKENASNGNKRGVVMERRICPIWFQDFEWLMKIENGNLSCLWCKSSQTNLVSPFGNSEGCSNFKKETLEAHNSSVKHKQAKEVFLKIKDTKEGKNGLSNYFNNRTKNHSKNIVPLLQNVYFCCWHMASISFAEDLNYHIQRCGIDLGDHYLSVRSIREMALSLAFTIQNQLKNEVVVSKSFFSLLLDESTDVAKESKLLLLVRYCNGVEIKEKYLAICKLSSNKASDLFHRAWNILSNEQYNLNKLIVVLGDNANTIQGEINGVIAKFKEKLPYVNEGRCTSHLNNLIVKNFVEKMPKISIFKHFIYKLIDYMKKSPKRIETFKLVQKEITDDIRSLVMPFDIRWISLYSSISCIIEVILL